ncbi:hypothetical protein K7432_015860 [Basidiobolus ranarum]|uniref:Chitin-binding type-1 domain-containing protein n=1 Tax=Basidiobolus ranarum TaxID=34480 RepID=A0ABR2VNH7_9FUNG
MKFFFTLLAITLAAKSIEGAPANDRYGRLITRATPLRKLNEKCGSKYGSCGSGLCCSQWGYCGYSSDHCSDGCQKNYGTCDSSLKKLNEQCGSKYGTCDAGLCCSEWGYCGYSSDHCTGKCQSKYGTCGTKTTKSSSTSKPTSSASST